MSDAAVDAAARAIYEATDPKWTAVWTWDKLHDQDDWRRLARAALAAALPIERAAWAEEIARVIELGNPANGSWAYAADMVRAAARRGGTDG